ncbi:MAG: hypothetical protein LIP02_11315 [Bacteroidales bacterium]|nr:hypothetical protein [Bacteroidales bacterium]
MTKKDIEKDLGYSITDSDCARIEEFMNCARSCSPSEIYEGIKPLMTDNDGVPDWLVDIDGEIKSMRLGWSNTITDRDNLEDELGAERDRVATLEAEVASLKAQLAAMTSARDQYKAWWEGRYQADDDNKALIKGLTRFIADNL